MDAKTIGLLTAYDPASRVKKITLAEAIVRHPGQPIHKEAAESFKSRYYRLSFGWYIARQFAVKKMVFPVSMAGRDSWVFKAYLMMVDPYNYFDPHVSDAFHFANTPKELPQYGDDLKTMLLTLTSDHPKTHMQEVARRTGIPYESIEAFETLFYNVLDRREDRLYIAKEVYPNTRIVEYDENYMKNSKMSDLLKRAGYNHRDMDLAEYLIGMGDRAYMARISSAENREAELAKSIVGNGLILTRTNLLNQPSVGINRTITLMAAARQAGASVEEPPTSGLAGIIDEQLERVRGFHAANMSKLLKADAAQFIEADVVNVV